MQYNCCPKHTIVLFWAIFRSDVKENKKILYLQRRINYSTINEQISNAFVRLHKPFRQKSTILMVGFCHLP